MHFSFYSDLQISLTCFLFIIIFPLEIIDCLKVEGLSFGSVLSNYFLSSVKDNNNVEFNDNNSVSILNELSAFLASSVLNIYVKVIHKM